MNFENFFIDLPLIKQKVVNIQKIGDMTKFGDTTFLLKSIFIYMFWDNNKKDKLGYFEYDFEFLSEFRRYFSKLFIPIGLACTLYLVKSILFLGKMNYIYIILCSSIGFECFYFSCYPIKDGREYQNGLKSGRTGVINPVSAKEFYNADNNKLKFIELIPLLVAFICLIYIAVY